ncbi:MAG: hypothetical protein QOH00_2820, partial [Gaiellales bacterium]|nr:hypothetical protein [Gaiellales bacterium]
MPAACTVVGDVAVALMDRRPRARMSPRRLDDGRAIRLVVVGRSPEVRSRGPEPLREQFI